MALQDQARHLLQRRERLRYPGARAKALAKTSIPTAASRASLRSSGRNSPLAKATRFPGSPGMVGGAAGPGEPVSRPILRKNGENWKTPQQKDIQRLATS